jgi:hypothetical protein
VLAEAEGRGGQGAGEEGDVDVGMVEGEIVADENEVERDGGHPESPRWARQQELRQSTPQRLEEAQNNSG